MLMLFKTVEESYRKPEFCLHHLDTRINPLLEPIQFGFLALKI
jgi:hypothetical protein